MKIKLFLTSALIACLTVMGHAKERVHTVIKDDWLSRLSRSYYGDPVMWKIIWERNPYIKNPDLIFPGDKIIIPDMGAKEKPAPAPKAEVVQEENEIICAYDSRRNHIEFDYDGFILCGGENKRLLSFSDMVFIDAGKNKGVKPFDLFSIWRVGKPITPPESFVPVAIIMTRVGTVKVSRDIEEASSSATIIECREPVQAGDMIRRKGTGIEEPVTRPGAVGVKELFISPWRADRGTFEFDYEGFVVEFQEARNIAGYNEKIYMDLGSSFFAEEGAVYVIYRKGAAVGHPQTSKMMGIPVEKIGYAQVVLGPKGRNTAIVIECSKPVLKGDMVKKWIPPKQGSPPPWEVVK